MVASDLPAAVAVSAAAFGLELGDPAALAGWRRRVSHPVQTDPHGAFVAEHGGRVVGVAAAIRRERLWILSLLTVDPGASGGGAGRELLAAARSYARAGDAQLIVSSNDPRALRLYGRAGLRLEPTFEARGRLDPRALPHVPDVVDVTDDLDRHLGALDAISVSLRGAPHRRELPHALARGARVLALGDRGFAVAEPGQSVWLLAARDEDAGRMLLRAALAVVGGDHGARPVVRWITAGQQWAIEGMLEAGLSLVAYGALCVLGGPGPLAPFIPSPPFG